MKETLGKLYLLHGFKKAQQIVNKELKEFVDNSFELGLKVAAKVWAELLDNCNGNNFFTQIRGNFDLNLGISVITLIQVTCINKFHEDLRVLSSKQFSESSTSNLFDVEERYRFQKNLMTNMKSELARNAEKLTEKMIEYLIHNHNEFT